MERGYVNGKKEKRWRETETLQGCCSCASPDWCVCVCGHWLRLPGLPVLLEMPGAIMCYDRDWFLWLTTLAAALLCHANEQTRILAGLTADRQAVSVISLTRIRKRRDRRADLAPSRDMTTKSFPTRQTARSLANVTSDKQTNAHTQISKQARALKLKNIPHKHSGVILSSNCVPLRQRNP